MISSTDSVLVRAAASSIASGNPSSEWQRLRTAWTVSCSRPGTLGGDAAAEQLDGIVESEWGELDDVLAVEVEWDLARGQHAQRRAGIEKAGGEVGGGIDHVLAVVEDDDGLGTGRADRRAPTRRR